jgi:hypothetical protein
VVTSIRLAHGLQRTKVATTSADDPITAPPTNHPPQETDTVFSPERAAKRRRRLAPPFAHGLDRRMSWVGGSGGERETASLWSARASGADRGGGGLGGAVGSRGDHRSGLPDASPGGGGGRGHHARAAGHRRTFLLVGDSKPISYTNITAILDADITFIAPLAAAGVPDGLFAGLDRAAATAVDYITERDEENSESPPTFRRHRHHKPAFGWAVDRTAIDTDAAEVPHRFNPMRERRDQPSGLVTQG